MGLVEHARLELDLLGDLEYGPELTDCIMEVIETFAKYGHSGGSAGVTITLLNELLRYKNLTPLTDNPGEWIHHPEEMWGKPGGIWQSCRNPEAFSTDGGKTYYLLSENEDFKTPEVFHPSESKWRDT
jgi:hypothetical protein